MCLTIIGGALGNFIWIITGLSINSSHMLDHSKFSFREMAGVILNFGYFQTTEMSQADLVSADQYHNSNLLTEELNPMSSFETHKTVLALILFICLAAVSSLYQSDVLWGRASFLGKINCIIVIIATNICYLLLLMSFSNFELSPSWYLTVCSFILIISFGGRASRFTKAGRKIDHNLEAPEQQVIVDREAKGFLINKNSQGMVTKLASKYGTPFVGVHKTIVRDIYLAASDEKSDHFFVFAVSGRRGTGKTRIVYESFKKPERKDDFLVCQGEAGVKDDEQSKDMDMDDEAQQVDKDKSVKTQK